MSERSKEKESKRSQASQMPADMQITVSGGARRLPVYLLLDTSGSMAGAPIESVRLGLEQFAREVKNDPTARDAVHVGLITFGGEANFVTHGLVSFDSFQTPSLSAGGETPLGQAFYLLIESLDKDIKTSVKGGTKGDWKPLVFILTDGKPTDQWREPRDEILRRQKNKVLNIITVGCGPFVNQQNLVDIAGNDGISFNVGNDEHSFSQYFKWVSQTVISRTRTISQTGGDNKPIETPPPPGSQFIP